mgnify:CR=1 FL=1
MGYFSEFLYIHNPAERFSVTYENGYTVNLYACEVDSKQSELHQTMRVMPLILGGGLPLRSSRGRLTAAKCATRLVTRGNKSYRIAVIIYDHTAG